jgi:hypothetical protein
VRCVTLEQVGREHIVRVLRECGGVVSTADAGLAEIRKGIDAKRLADVSGEHGQHRQGSQQVEVCGLFRIERCQHKLAERRAANAISRCRDRWLVKRTDREMTKTSIANAVAQNA